MRRPATCSAKRNENELLLRYVFHDYASANAFCNPVLKQISTNWISGHRNQNRINLWLNKVLANENRLHICYVLLHWLRFCESRQGVLGKFVIIKNPRNVFHFDPFIFRFKSIQTGYKQPVNRPFGTKPSGPMVWIWRFKMLVILFKTQYVKDLHSLFPRMKKVRCALRHAKGCYDHVV